jgi:isopenicillin N synthase-like dioxygenase
MRCFSLKKGYVPINGTENAVRKPEFHEKFSCGRLLESYERSNDPYYDPNRSLFFDCENTFPRNVFGVTREKGEEDAFEEAYSSLYREMERFSEQLLRVFAMSLNMKEEELEYFVERSRKHVTNLVALRYDVSRAKRTLKKKEEDEDDTLLVRAHTDPTDFTCLFFDDERGPNGLQILIEEEEGGARGESRWIDVPKVPNAMLVNVGDVLMAWTNGEYKSTRHRVILNRNSNKEEEEDEEEEEESRLSLVWFHCPNYDALIDSRDVDARKKNLSNTTPPKYAPFLCKDRTHFQQTERTKRGLKDRQLTSTHDTRVRGLDVENS